MKQVSILLLLAFLLSACQPSLWGVSSTPTPPVFPIFLPTVTPTGPASTDTAIPSAPTAVQIADEQPSLWIGAAVPSSLRDKFLEQGFQLTPAREAADLVLDLGQPSISSPETSAWTFALAAPFPTIVDGVTSQELLSAWNASFSGPFNGIPLLMDESTLAAFSALWGEPAHGAVRIVAADELLDAAWTQMPAWAIIPFERVEPKWKVLTIDGQSPIQKGFDSSAYPLVANYELKCLSNCPPVRAFQNRDESKLATVILTGVTALVRATAFTMETKGVTRPGELIRDWLVNADVAHISNEVPFDPTCPFPEPGHKNFILCSDPKYMELLIYVGTDIVELTGDHFADRGTQAMLDTLEIYRQNGIPYYGGGANAEEARQPVLMEVNGNKIAFMGCNGKRAYDFVKATATRPGAADCDFKFFEQQIQDVTAQGYMVIFTFQHEECYHPGPCYAHEFDFHRVADAGAVIVSGSQAHFPHLMEFRGDTFIHYGLGNLFFDQMTYELPNGQVIDGTRREFIDRHVFYDGRYLGVELLTAMLEDFSRPRPMNERERTAFLAEYFFHSGWVPLAPTPVPVPTVTLTPIVLPQTP